MKTVVAAFDLGVDSILVREFALRLHHTHRSSLGHALAGDVFQHGWCWLLHRLKTDVYAFDDKVARVDVAIEIKRRLDSWRRKVRSQNDCGSVLDAFDNALLGYTGGRPLLEEVVCSEVSELPKQTNQMLTYDRALQSLQRLGRAVAECWSQLLPEPRALPEPPVLPDLPATAYFSHCLTVFKPIFRGTHVEDEIEGAGRESDSPETAAPECCPGSPRAGDSPMTHHIRWLDARENVKDFTIPDFRAMMAIAKSLPVSIVAAIPILTVLSKVPPQDLWSCLQSTPTQKSTPLTFGDAVDTIGRLYWTLRQGLGRLDNATLLGFTTPLAPAAKQALAVEKAMKTIRDAFPGEKLRYATRRQIADDTKMNNTIRGLALDRLEVSREWRGRKRRRRGPRRSQGGK